MFLTLIYMAATWFHVRRLKPIYDVIYRSFLEKSSVSLYNFDDSSSLAFTSPSSDICKNSDQARIVDLFWLEPGKRGCTLNPIQIVENCDWNSFSYLNNRIPFKFDADAKLDLESDKLVNILVETSFEQEMNSKTLRIENYGEFISWKADTHLSILLKSDVPHLCELATLVFVRNDSLINDGFPVTRIETVDVVGTPQPLDQIVNYVRNVTPAKTSAGDLKQHILTLQNISRFAYQANEYVNQQQIKADNKPDLIVSNSCHSTEMDDEVSANDELTKRCVENGIIEIVAVAVPVVDEEILSEECVITPDVAPSEVIPSVDTPDTCHKSPEPLLTESFCQTEPVEISSPIAEEIPTPSKTVEAKQQTCYSRRPSESSRKQSLPTPKTDAPKKSTIIASKPPNILVYSESSTTRNNVVQTLRNVTAPDQYTIYELTKLQIDAQIWLDNATLLVVSGNVSDAIGKYLLDFFLCGGKILCLCTDLLHIILPTHRTAEVRENELVQFTYGKWRKIKMMHHIFCYQPSPVKKHFSQDTDEVVYSVPSQPKMMCPRSVTVYDLQGVMHELTVEVLGHEETWNTPSLMSALDPVTGGKAVFSQVHLETDFNKYEEEEQKFTTLQENEKSRLEILADVLVSQLGINAEVQGLQHFTYQCGYFLGRHEAKFDLLAQLKYADATNKIVDNGKMRLQFVGKGETAPRANALFLPIMLHSCPDSFSTIDYFDNLKTDDIGRMVMYVPNCTTSTNVISNLKLVHGFAVIPRQQTQGAGRSQNQWLSPDGCLMFTLQLHIPLSSELGLRISLIQHLTATAIVRAILKLEGCANLNIGLKWPNDIYAYGTTKIGGLIINSQMDSRLAICNIGCGLNLSNSKPTLCLHDIIQESNILNKTEIPPLPSYEKMLAAIFTEIESLYNCVQAGGVELFYEYYYQIWLHSDAEVTVIDKNKKQFAVKIIGIDDYGFLSVQKSLDTEPISLHPDGNSFDIFRGLIMPKDH